LKVKQNQRVKNYILVSTFFVPASLSMLHYIISFSFNIGLVYEQTKKYDYNYIVASLLNSK